MITHEQYGDSLSEAMQHAARSSRPDRTIYRIQGANEIVPRAIRRVLVSGVWVEIKVISKMGWFNEVGLR